MNKQRPPKPDEKASRVATDLLDSDFDEMDQASAEWSIWRWSKREEHVENF
jgi:hypothetical protein